MSTNNYALIAFQGQQFKVMPGMTFEANRMNTAEVGAALEVKDVLLISKDGMAVVGTPHVKGSVSLKVVKHTRGPKILVYKKKRRKGYTKQQGHRQDLTQFLVESING